MIRPPMVTGGQWLLTVGGREGERETGAEEKGDKGKGHAGRTGEVGARVMGVLCAVGAGCSLSAVRVVAAMVCCCGGIHHAYEPQEDPARERESLHQAVLVCHGDGVRACMSSRLLLYAPAWPSPHSVGFRRV